MARAARGDARWRSSRRPCSRPQSGRCPARRGARIWGRAKAAGAVGRERDASLKGAPASHDPWSTTHQLGSRVEEREHTWIACPAALHGQVAGLQQLHVVLLVGRVRTRVSLGVDPRRATQGVHLDTQIVGQGGHPRQPADKRALDDGVPPERGGVLDRLTRDTRLVQRDQLQPREMEQRQELLELVLRAGGEEQPDRHRRWAAAAGESARACRWTSNSCAMPLSASVSNSSSWVRLKGLPSA